MNTKILRMLELQNNMNLKVNPDWQHQNFAWYRAIWIECAELLEHHGWKWWKKQTPDIEQIKLELVDIWHFGLSMLINEYKDHKLIAKNVSKELFQHHNDSSDFLENVELFAAQVLTQKKFPTAQFYALLDFLDMDFNELYRMYIGKNVLNFFRQDHGYKTGEYIKVWQGKEDNEYLVEIIQQLDVNSETFQEDIYQQLSLAYEEKNSKLL